MKGKLLLILCFFMISCTSNTGKSNKEGFQREDLSLTSFPQKWSLYKITASLAGSESTGTNLPYEEYYIFRADNTFSKTRIRFLDFEKTIAKGSYKLDLNSEQFAYKLNYYQDSDLIENCTGDKKEYLYLDTDSNSLLSSWWNCDGPGLFYKQDDSKINQKGN